MPQTGGRTVNKFLSDVTLLFFVSLGVVVGGSFTGGIAAALTGELPMSTMKTLAERLKLWGAVASLGGAFYTLQTLEAGLLEGQLRGVIRQLLYIIAAFAGAQLGLILIYRLVGKP